MHIKNFQITDNTIATIAAGGTYKILSYKIDEKEKQIHVTTTTDTFDVVYIPHNLDFLENCMYKDLLQMKKTLNNYAVKELPLLKTNTYLFSALFFILLFSPTTFPLALLDLFLATLNKSKIHAYQNFSKDINELEWLHLHQETIHHILQDPQFYQSLSPTTKLALKDNANRYCLNNFASVPKEDRQKIFIKVESHD